MCARLVAAIAAEVPAEVGRWDEAWRMTAATDRQFMDALATWEADESAENVAKLRAAFDAHVETWRTVAELWRNRHG